MSIACSTNQTVTRVDQSTIDSFSEYSPALVSDCYGHKNIMDPGIKPLNQNSYLCGSAITVDLPPGDNLMLHAALNLAEEGDVLVVNTKNDINSGIWGEIMTNAAMARGLAGLVLDGSCRDSHWIRESGWPLFSRGICARGSQKVGPGHVNLTITCGTVVVQPGDLIIGDCDGIMVLPAKDAVKVLPICAKKKEQEKKRVENIQAGEIKPIWLEPSLQKFGLKTRF